MSEWDSVSEEARNTMKELGFFSPTVRAERREVKGYGYWGDDEAGKVYLTAADLRRMAVDLVEVANWLDKRTEGTPPFPTESTADTLGE